MHCGKVAGCGRSREPFSPALARPSDSKRLAEGQRENGAERR